MSFKTREYTKKLLEAVNEGLLDKDTVLLACLDAMSESEVAYMCDANNFFEHEDEDGEDIDNPNWVGSRYHY
jgi:hypothetical protein